MTVEQLYNACKNNKYIIVTDMEGYRFGINCLIAEKALKQRNHDMSDETRFQSYYSCTLLEYINRKLPFVNQ